MTNAAATNTLTLYVLTHCESCYNRRGIFTGRVDSKLTPKGHEHAIRLAQRLKNKKIDIAYTSPLKRTRETLRRIAAYHPDMTIVIDKRLIERDYGTLARKNKQKYQREHPDVFPIYHRSYDVAPPGGESIKQVEQRVLAFIHDVLNHTQHNHHAVLIITHSNAIRPIRKYFEHLSNGQMMKLENLRHIIFTYKIKLGGKRS